MLVFTSAQEGETRARTLAWRRSHSAILHRFGTNLGLLRMGHAAPHPHHREITDQVKRRTLGCCSASVHTAAPPDPFGRCINWTRTAASHLSSFVGSHGAGYGLDKSSAPLRDNRDKRRPFTPPFTPNPCPRTVGTRAAPQSSPSSGDRNPGGCDATSKNAQLHLINVYFNLSYLLGETTTREKNIGRLEKSKLFGKQVPVK